MEYVGLTQDDLQNVQALNRAWLHLDRGEAPDLPRLTAKQQERFAAAPFLLFSFREQDDRLWRSLLEDGGQQDLLVRPLPASGERQALQFAGLAFLWGLARRNPYVARIVSGAPLNWCEQIASMTLIRLLDRTTCCEVIESRFDDTTPLHRRLLRRGGSALRELRIFAQIGALQSMLTSSGLEPYRRLPAAACRIPRTTQQVADEV